VGGVACGEVMAVVLRWVYRWCFSLCCSGTLSIVFCKLVGT